MWLISGGLVEVVRDCAGWLAFRNCGKLGCVCGWEPYLLSGSRETRKTALWPRKPNPCLHKNQGQQPLEQNIRFGLSIFDTFAQHTALLRKHNPTFCADEGVVAIIRMDECLSTWLSHREV